MKEIAQEITAATKGTHVLKGGAALLFVNADDKMNKNADEKMYKRAGSRI